MISIQKSGDTINFTFTDSSHYLYGNGTISVPENSLTLTIDESDIVNFKKADSNDIFISATLGEFGKTKAELIQFYKDNMVNAGISSGDVETMISSATSGFADSVSYNSTTKYVEFFNGNTKVFEYDASEFVIDGMVDNVEIKTISSGGTNVDVLAITFNVESGKNEIDIPLSDIFDPDLYYTKTEVDSALSGKADTSAVTADIAAAVSGKADTSAVTADIAAAVSGKVDTSAFTSYSSSIKSRLSEDEEVTSAALNALNETVEGKVDASAITSAVTSGSTDAEIPTAKAVYDAIPQGGGGKAIEAGRGITITTGETADTVSFDLPISADSKNNICIGALNLNYDKGKEMNFLFGNSNTVKTPAQYNGRYNFLFGLSNTVGKAQGRYDTQYNAVFGLNNICYLNNSLICGISNLTYNNSEFSSGQYNNSVSGSTTFGYSGNTLFSIGNGTYNARHNAFEVRQNGDIYCSDGTNDVKLQDYIQHKIVQMTQSEYDALANKDANTIYIIVN